MGIDLYSGNFTFGCSYSGWNRLRYFIIISTLKYLEDFIIKNANNEDDNNDQRKVDDVKYFLKKIDEVRYYHNTNNSDEDKLLHVFISVIKSNIYCLDTLISLHVAGLFSLCYKSDCEGFYSPGNSLDICNLLDTIKPFVRDIDNHTYNNIYTKDERVYDNILYEVFEYSWKNNIVIVIT